MSIKRIGAALGLMLATVTVQAQDITPAVIFDMGGKFDKSFNQGVYDGVERFKADEGIDYREFEVTNETQSMVWSIYPTYSRLCLKNTKARFWWA